MRSMDSSVIGGSGIVIDFPTRAGARDRLRPRHRSRPSNLAAVRVAYEEGARYHQEAIEEERIRTAIERSTSH